MSQTIMAGLDDSGSSLAFAAQYADGSVIFDEFVPLNSRPASGLPVCAAEILEKHGLDVRDIAEWSVGAGPGSFTGLRIASAFVMGLTFGRPEVRTRCVSSASMIASCAGADAESVLVLFDGRKSEILACGLKKTPDGFREDGFSCVIRGGDAAAAYSSEYALTAAFASDHDAVRKVAGAFADGVVRVERLSALPLIRFRPGDFSRPLTDLTYLRPAVFVEPQKVRQI